MPAIKLFTFTFKVTGTNTFTSITLSFFFPLREKRTRQSLMPEPAALTSHVTVRAPDPPIATDDVFGWQDAVGRPAQLAQLPECREVSLTQRTGTAVKANNNEVPSSSCYIR